MNKIINWKKQFAIIYAGQAFSILGSAAVQFAIIWWLTIQTESAITLTIASVVA
ncbi:MAG: cation:proton antiporter, partial [Eubacteriaceae bacterium]|nr:cation:proton antiporter [Eubacteriaceae bacterium]